MTEDEMVEWYHQINGHEFEQTLGDSESQGSPVCCCSWGSQEVGQDLMTEQQQWQFYFFLSFNNSHPNKYRASWWLS